MQWQIEPMPRWPYPETKSRRWNPFRAKFDATLELLADELDHLKVEGAVAVRVVAAEADVRRDGMLRARAEVRHPGVAISFTSAKLGALTYPCDAFKGRYYGDPDWQVNLRAIALGLQHLRALDRYGVAARGEQYAGWRAIESTAPVGFGSVDDAVRWLAEFTERSRHTALPVLLRLATRLAHPDVGGDPTAWARVDAARQLLKRAGVIA
ncbi:hypothetical protein [Amycolatopsis circi]|uniref:hypothetical protein n=1 Tax=Amycolatopsis circi TaxID=871959 RepID=UPI000E245C70|nr:hypothetical protein [Amycolatopsis circi]